MNNVINKKYHGRLHFFDYILIGRISNNYILNLIILIMMSDTVF